MLPGLRRFDHIGFTVPDLDEAHTFLVDVLGCEYLYPLGPYVHDDSDWMAEHLNVHPRASMVNRFYRLGGQAVLEVFRYTAPDQNPVPPRNSDVGGHHVAIYVDDLDVAVGYLRERGVTVLGDPTTSSGAHAGQRWVYFLAPWGMQFELVSYPNGRRWYLEEAARAAAAAVRDLDEIGAVDEVGAVGEVGAAGEVGGGPGVARDGAARR